MTNRYQVIFRIVIRLGIVALILFGIFTAFGDEISINSGSELTEDSDELGENYEFIAVASEENYVSDQDFRENSTRSVVLFTSTWCGSCKYLSELMQSESTLPEYQDMYFYEVDIDQNWELANALDVSVTPSMVFIDDVDFAVKREVSPEDVAGDSSQLVFFLPGGVFNLDFYSLDN